MRRAPLLACSSLVFSVACGGWGGGTSWMQEPLVPDERAPMDDQRGFTSPSAAAVSARTIGGQPSMKASRGISYGDGGTVLGTFRNTYYDFPSASEHVGPPVPLMSATCEPIATVPRGFYEAVCVQGSGSLASGRTVSFAKRDCACAEICPRTKQRICFDALDKDTFPWGRGASGRPITPLRSVAADTRVLPMGTVIYIPELDGASRGEDAGRIDGCFVVEDRGLHVQGEHVDIFTGHPRRTTILNAEVPSNQGVTVVVDAPRCAHLTPKPS